jgi:hypothetical protein
MSSGYQVKVVSFIKNRKLKSCAKVSLNNKKQLLTYVNVCLIRDFFNYFIANLMVDKF